MTTINRNAIHASTSQNSHEELPRTVVRFSRRIDPRNRLAGLDEERVSPGAWYGTRRRR